MYYIQTAIASGGYIVLGTLESSRGYWFNPEDEIYEYNEATNIDPLHLLRCNGTSTKMTRPALEKRLQKDLLHNDWVYVYRYSSEGSEDLQGFEEAAFICFASGKWGVYDKELKLIAYVPKSSGVYLHAYKGVPLIHEKIEKNS